MPFSVYESLPYFYLLFGAAALLGIDPVFGQLCGLLLCLSGLVILKMRIRYRRSFVINTVMVTKSW